MYHPLYLYTISKMYSFNTFLKNKFIAHYKYQRDLESKFSDKEFQTLSQVMIQNQTHVTLGWRWEDIGFFKQENRNRLYV